MNKVVAVTLLAVSIIGLAAAATADLEQYLAELSDVQQCDQRLVSTLVRAEALGLRESGDHLRRVLDLCTAFVEQRLAQTLRELAAGDQLIDRLALLAGRSYDLWCIDKQPDQQQAILDEASQVSSASQLSAYLRQLSQQDSEVRLTEVVFDETSRTSSVVERADRLEAALDKYLVEPCRKLETGLGDLLEGARAIGRIESNLGVFVERRPVEFRRLAFTFQVCRNSVLRMDDEAKTRLSVVAADSHLELKKIDKQLL